MIDSEPFIQERPATTAVAAIIGSPRQDGGTTNRLNCFWAGPPTRHRLAALLAGGLLNRIGLFPARSQRFGGRLLARPPVQLFLRSRVDTSGFIQGIQLQVGQQGVYRFGNLFLKFFLPTIATARSGSRT